MRTNTRTHAVTHTHTHIHTHEHTHTHTHTQTHIHTDTHTHTHTHKHIHTRRWVATFQKTLRMLWEAHVRRSEGPGTADPRSARQRALDTTGADHHDRAWRSHIVTADVVPPFIEVQI